MRARGLAGIAAAALVGAVTVGLSLTGGGAATPAPAAVSEPLAAADPLPSGTAGVLAPAPQPPRLPHAYNPPAPVAFELPPAVAQRLSSPATASLTPIPVTIGALGIPELVLGAYRSAEATLAAETPGCGVTWHLLAGIGRIESGHAGGGRTDAAGTTVTPILGPRLDGSLAGNNVILDTDRGAIDGDPGHDRAVGPMQFIPGTWARYASDGNDDGRADPNNVFDAALAAARYLCSGGLDLRDDDQELRAILRYNYSMAYAANVRAWSAAYAAGAIPTPGSIPEVPTEPGRPAEPAPSTGPAPDAAPTPESNPDVLRNAAAPIPAFPGLPALPTLPPLPCLAFCPPAPEPAAPTSVTAPAR
ncbi:lytic transglycosylase domain-containing protein [Rhodococcus sp. NPDC003318]|uniref:lytic transglycosylase domain-containing protein n=1 Tax=Rhodococcus sp. NPDC003318 TaxID=3364503 RepID=UPI003673CFC4